MLFLNKAPFYRGLNPLSYRIFNQLIFLISGVIGLDAYYLCKNQLRAYSNTIPIKA